MDGIDVFQALSRRSDAITIAALPIYKYYFPESWLAPIKVLLRISKPPDWAKFQTELQSFAHESSALKAAATQAVNSMDLEGMDPRVRHALDLMYRQICFDAEIVILLDLWTNGMLVRDKETASLGITIALTARKGAQNKRELKAWPRTHGIT